MIGPSHEGNKARNDHKPWVYRTGPPVSLTTILCVLALGLVVGIMALASSGCTTQPATSSQYNSFTVGESATLRVTTLGGRIEINASDSDNVVSVTAELRDVRRIRYEAIQNQNSNEIVVTAEKTNDWWFPAGSTRADIYVTVPADTALRLKTSNGKIVVQGTTAGGILETSNGSIVLEEVKGDFEATTSNGAVDIETIEGSVHIKSSNGDVTLREAKGEFDARTSNGRIIFSGEMTAEGSNRLVTSNGRIEVELLGTPSISLDASTSNGGIKHDDVYITATTTDTEHVVGTIGAGEAYLYIETSNGDVIIK